ncbi:MAG TPA: hypothetical protein VL154_19555, partial [Acetobacteraceae bacterium]|nr:hypothetical protein [Acetobacteraceae bacterium]
MQVSASKRRFFEKKRAKNFIRLATPGGRRGRSLQPQRAKRRHEVFLLLFVHKKKTFLASLSWAPTCCAITAKLFNRRKEALPSLC